MLVKLCYETKGEKEIWAASAEYVKHLKMLKAIAENERRGWHLRSFLKALFKNILLEVITNFLTL